MNCVDEMAAGVFGKTEAADCQFDTKNHNYLFLNYYSISPSMTGTVKIAILNVNSLFLVQISVYQL